MQAARSKSTCSSTLWREQGQGKLIFWSWLRMGSRLGRTNWWNPCSLGRTMSRGQYRQSLTRTVIPPSKYARCGRWATTKLTLVSGVTQSVSRVCMCVCEGRGGEGSYGSQCLLVTHVLVNGVNTKSGDVVIPILLLLFHLLTVYRTSIYIMHYSFIVASFLGLIKLSIFGLHVEELGNTG